MRSLLLLALLVLVGTSAVVAQTPPFQFTHKGSIVHIKFSPTGTRLLSYSSGNQDLCMWDVRSGKVLWKRPIDFIQVADEYFTLNAFAWSPDEKLIATGSANGTIQLWDAETGNFIWRSAIAKRDITAVAFDPNQKMIAATSSADDSTGVRLVNVQDGQVVQELRGNVCTGISIGFNGPDHIQVGNLDGNIAEWDIRSGSLMSNFAAPCRQMRTYDWDTSFSDDLKLSVVRTTSNDVSIKDNLLNKTLTSTKASDSKITSAVVSQGQKAVVSENIGYRLFDLKTGKDSVIKQCFVGNTFDLSKDGSLFAEECDGFRTAIKITDLKSRKEWYLDGHPSSINGISFSSDYLALAVAGNDGNVYIFDPVARSVVRSIDGVGDRLTAIAFGPAGKTLVTGDAHGTVKLWDVASGKLLNETKLTDRSDDIDRLEFNNDGTRILAVSNRELSILNPQQFLDRTWIRTAEGFESKSGVFGVGYSSVPITSAYFSRDVNNVVTGHVDGTVRIWDASTARQLSSVNVGDSVLLLNPTPDSKIAVATVTDGKSKVIEEINIENGSVIKRTKDIDITFPETASVSLNGRYATVTGNIGETIVCDLTDMSIRILPYEYSGGDSVAFSKDSRTFFIGGENQNLELYETTSLKKIWELIPAFQPSAAELKLKEESRRRNQILADTKSRRDRQAAVDVEKYSKLISISFLHFGDMSDPGEKRMVQSDKVNESKRTKPRSSANAAWFRLTNNSPIPINVPTESMYLPNPKCFHQFSNGEKLFGSCGEREVRIWFGVKDKNGNWVPYGFDFGSSVNLLPGSSVVFPVPLSLLKKDYRIVFSCAFQNVRASENDREWDYGEKIELSIDNSRLPK